MHLPIILDESVHFLILIHPDALGFLTDFCPLSFQPALTETFLPQNLFRQNEYTTIPKRHLTYDVKL